MTQPNRRITLAANGNLKPVILDGVTTEQFFLSELDYLPSAHQLRINGAEYRGDVAMLELKDGDIVQVLSPATAQKGVAGA